MSIESPGVAPVSVLVADDEQLVRDALCLHLRDSGYEVSEACNGEEALELAQRLKPALLILDVTMPKMNGWEVARRLRANEATAAIKLLMISCIGPEVLDAGVPVLGGDLGLDKPFELDELDLAMANLLTAG